MNLPTLTAGVARPRLSHALFQFRQKSIRERADFLLFVAGLFVEYVLLFALFTEYARRGEVAFANYVVMFALFFALAVHQFLIFRNSTLQYALPGSRLEVLELVICLFFGVLTGELGYLLVLGICSKPEWLLSVPVGVGWIGAAVIVIGLTVLHVFLARQPGQRLVSNRLWMTLAGALIVITLSAVFVDRNVFAIRASARGLEWAFAEEPLVITATNTQGVADGGGLALATIQWFAHALGRALKAVFACGAMGLSLLILVWDIMARGSFAQSAATASNEDDKAVRTRAYRTTMFLFFILDGFAAFTWAMVLGVVLPTGLGFLSATACFTLLGYVSLLYAALAVYRLIRARETVQALSSDVAAATTVI